MPSLLDHYKEYRKLLDQTNVVLTKLEVQSEPINDLAPKNRTLS